jgi:hypothetical protein
MGGPNAPEQLQIRRDSDKSGPSECGADHVSMNLTENSGLVSMESYASIELGVAKLEIFFQDSLECMAMMSNGWRCQEFIPDEQLVKARELLCSSALSEADLDIDLLSQLVLCSGHANGELPRIYSERWAAFVEQRMPKEEAMSKFNADFWMSIQFFDNEKRDELTPPRKMNRPRSASNLSSRRSERHDFVSNRRSGGESLGIPLNAALNPQGRELEFSLHDKSSNYRIMTTPSFWESFEKRGLSSKF